jgi:hypothetical protein
MLTFAKARVLAETWVRVMTDDEGSIVQEHTLTKPYGWVFVYQSRAFLASGRFEDRYAGNGPILVDRIDGEIRVFGTAHPVEYYLAEYEARIPAARLQMSLPREP